MPDDKTIKAIKDAHTVSEAHYKAMEKVTRITRPLGETLRAIEENSALAQLQKHLRTIEQSSGMARMVESMRLLDENSSIKKMMESVSVHEELARTAMGPMWELRQAGVFDVGAQWGKNIEAARLAVEGFQARFRLPEMAETARLLTEFKTSALSETLAKYAGEASALQRALEGMRTPWLDIQETMRSVAGFAEMQGIGHALRSMPAFDENLSASLRTALGDWRDEITWRPEILTDLAARADFYVGLGFNPALTDFPLPAFEQGLEIAGLRRVVPQAAEDAEADGEEEGLARTNAAHNQLQRMERSLRKFIDEKMTGRYGADWPQHRLPNGVYDNWREKKRKAEEAGAEERPLIEYADFMHYVPLICRGDNWREVFKRFFGREEDIRESFQRLHPIRLDIAHARLITLDDELLLCVEVKRLVKVIRRG